MLTVFKQKIILIVEDDLHMQQIYHDRLVKENYIVLQAVNTDEGLNLTINQNPDLIVLDIMLPGGKNGFDLLEELKRNPKTAHIPVVVLTNLDSEEKVAREIGADEYLVKSNSTIEDIVSAIKKKL